MKDLYKKTQKKVLKRLTKLKKRSVNIVKNLSRQVPRIEMLFASSWRSILSPWINLVKLFLRLVNTSPFRTSLYSIFFLILVLLPGQNRYERLSFSAGQIAIRHLPIAIPTPAPYPKNLNIYSPPPLTANSAMLVDVASQIALYEKNVDLPLPPASTTKIMTALIALDEFKLNQIILIKDVIYRGRIMGLVSGEKITVESLLYGLLVHSANDAAEAIAQAYPGGREAFVQAMNNKAQDLKLSNSHFTNPTGFDNQAHRMSARDLVRLSLIALKNPKIVKMVSTRSITVSDVDFIYFHDLYNVNELLGKMPGVAGFKTGYTDQAGESLVALLKRPQAELLAVILGSQDRFGEMEDLLKWGILNFAWEELSETAQPTR